MRCEAGVGAAQSTHRSENVLSGPATPVPNRIRPMPAQKEYASAKQYTKPSTGTSLIGAGSRRRQEAIVRSWLYYGRLWRSSCTIRFAGQADQACRLRSSGPKRRLRVESDASCKRRRARQPSSARCGEQTLSHCDDCTRFIVIPFPQA